MAITGVWREEKQTYVSPAEAWGYRAEHTTRNQFDGDLENVTGAAWYHDHGLILDSITELDYDDGNRYFIDGPDDDTDLEGILDEAVLPATADGVQIVIDQILDTDADNIDLDLDTILAVLTTPAEEGVRWNDDLSDDDVKHILTECSITLLDLDTQKVPLIVADDLLGDLHSLATNTSNQSSRYEEIYLDLATGELSYHLHASRNSWTVREGEEDGVDFVKLLAGPGGIEADGRFFRPVELEHDFENCFEEIAEDMPRPEGFDPDEDCLSDFYDVEDVVRFLHDGRTEYDEAKDTLMIREIWIPVLCDAIESAASVRC